MCFAYANTQSGTTVINITPPCKMEHRLLEHLHSTPLPSIISAEVARDCPDLRYFRDLRQSTFFVFTGTIFSQQQKTDE